MKPIYVVAALTVVVVAVTLMLLGPGKRREGEPAMKPIAEPVAAAAADRLAAPVHAQADCADWPAAVSKPSTNSLRPFFEAAEASDVVRCLQAGADPNARDEDGETPLHAAAENIANPSVIAVLLDAGADPKVLDNDGKLPFDYAEDNEKIKGTNAYWKLNDARFQ